MAKGTLSPDLSNLFECSPTVTRGHPVWLQGQRDGMGAATRLLHHPFRVGSLQLDLVFSHTCIYVRRSLYSGCVKNIFWLTRLFCALFQMEQKKRMRKIAWDLDKARCRPVGVMRPLKLSGRIRTDCCRSGFGVIGPVSALMPPVTQLGSCRSPRIREHREQPFANLAMLDTLVALLLSALTAYVCRRLVVTTA